MSTVIRWIDIVGVKVRGRVDLRLMGGRIVVVVPAGKVAVLFTSMPNIRFSKALQPSPLTLKLCTVVVITGYLNNITLYNLSCPGGGRESGRG